MKKGKKVECKSFTGLTQSGVVARGNSIRIEFWYKNDQQKAKFCTLDRVRSNEDFQELLDDAFYELKSIKRKVRDGIFTDESYASSLPLSTFAQKRGGSRSSTNFFELSQKYLDDQAPLIRRGQIAGSTVRARRKNLITSPYMKPLGGMLSMPNEAKHPTLIKHGLGDLLLGDVTFEMLRKLQTYLYDYVPRVDRAPGLSEKTVNNFFDAIKQVFKYALQNEIIEKDPSVNIKTLKVKTVNKIENLDFFDLSQQSAITQFLGIYKFQNWLTIQFSKFINKAGKFSLLAIGILNGFLPCGLVYMAIAGAFTNSNIGEAMQYMLFFGLGTLPLMLLVSIVGKAFKNKFKIRRFLPFLAALMGILLY